jgi:antitoxin component of RelBE/YafQ-DinJ toxin-antitoxin module
MDNESGGSGRRLLTFRLDTEQRQRLKARLAADGRTMSEVITHGLRQYVQHPRTRDTPPAVAPPASQPPAVAPSGPPPPAVAGPPAAPPAAAPPAGGGSPRPSRPALPEATGARLRELRASGRSGVLSATLAALHETGWPLPVLAEALGVSRQAIQARVRQRVPAELRDRAADCPPPPPFPRRREASKGRLRPHLTIKIDHALRAAAHRAAAHEGNSLSQVVESILDRYLRHGLPESPAPPSPARQTERVDDPPRQSGP